MVDISEVSCGALGNSNLISKVSYGARNDKSPEAVAWTPEL